MDQQGKTQWHSASELEKFQFDQLKLVVAHCAKQSPQFHQRLANAGLKPSELSSPEGLAKLPILERRDIQQATDFYCKSVPEAHKPVRPTTTSGSTGEPLTVQRTAVSNLHWLAGTMRDHIWHDADFSKPLAAMRATVPQVKQGEKWGPPVSLFHQTGPALAIPITKTGEEIYTLLTEFKPGNLLIYPGSLMALLDYLAATNKKLPSIEIIRTLGETVSPDLRRYTREQFGIPICDSYSSQEFGCIALQCPQTELYHIMAESLIVEVLDDEGRACKPGQVGRVVITDILNYATPLIRYAIGDYAEVGEPCACGRGLPTLNRVLGRTRNLVLKPDGRRHWPLVGFHRFREIAPILQYQLIQTGIETIQVNLSITRALTAQEEANLGEHIQNSLGFPYDLSFTYFFDRIPAGPSGKFEDFICQV